MTPQITPRIGPHSCLATVLKIDGRSANGRRLRRLIRELSAELPPDPTFAEHELVRHTAARIVAHELAVKNLIDQPEGAESRVKYLSWLGASVARDLERMTKMARAHRTRSGPSLATYLASRAAPEAA